MKPWHQIAMNEDVRPLVVGDDGGQYLVRKPGNPVLKVVASNGMGWDHVSVSLPHRTPTWAEMDYVKGLFFAPDEVAMQLHVADHDHINLHPNCLHIWKPQGQPIPLPDKIMV